MNPASIISIITDALLFISLFFEVFILISLLEKRSLRSHGSQPIVLPEILPSACIVVPCYNEEHTVALTIESLLSLDYPRELLQVVVIDDGSSDGTFDAASRFKHDSRVRVFRKENGGKHSALNYALERVDADLIGCLDADSTVAPDALKRVVAQFADQGVAAVTPGIHIQEPTTFLQHLQQAEYRLAIFTRAAFADIGSTYITPGPFSIFRSDVIRSVGGWRHAHSTEDLELGLRLQEIGCVIRNEPYASVYTKTPATLRALIRQRVRWTYGFLRNAADYRHMMGNAKYGNLGVMVLPLGVLSIAIVLYFTAFLTWEMISTLIHALRYIATVGIFHHLPAFDLFYFNTSMLSFIIYLSLAFVVTLLLVGSQISNERDRRLRPLGTVLYILFYGFLTPIWLSIAVLRATFKTGVRWK